jgi:uncharacterized membrane protein
VEAQVSASFSGPLPHPEILIQYNQAVPDGAERIIAMAERQSDHRMALEKRALTADIWRSYAGVAAGLIVALAVLAAAYQLIDNDHDTAGAALATIDIASLVGVFVFGTISRRQERKDRARWLAGDFRD